MQIEITRDYCKVRVESDGRIKEKIVNLSDLLDQLSVYKATNFGLLPRDVRIVESIGEQIIIGIEFPRKTWRIVFQPYGSTEEVFDNVSLPGGIFFEKLLREPGGSYKHINSHIFAFSGKRIMFNHDKLYNFPTPNIYGGGKVCWGNIKIEDIRHPSAVEGIVSSFFSNKFNNDLFMSKVNSLFPGPKSSVESYFKYLSENEFKDEWLIEYDLPIGKAVQRLLTASQF